MENTKAEIYFIHKPYFKEAMLLYSFKNQVNWQEEGLSLLSWEYWKISDTKNIDINKIYNYYKKWNGNAKSRKAGHRSITVGDVVVVGDNVRIITGKGWVVVPQVVWKHVKKIK